MIILKQTFCPFNANIQMITPKIYFLTVIMQVKTLDFKQHVEKSK